MTPYVENLPKPGSLEVWHIWPVFLLVVKMVLKKPSQTEHHFGTKTGLPNFPHMTLWLVSSLYDYTYDTILQAGLANKPTAYGAEEELQEFHILQLDHFSLPFTLWAVGILSSIIAFIMELIIFKHN